MGVQMNKDKVARASVVAFYHGGAKVQAASTLTLLELQNHIRSHHEGGKKSVVIDTVNENPEIADDVFVLVFDQLLFYTIFEQSKLSIVKPANHGIISSIKNARINE